jgi:restriction system protein
MDSLARSMRAQAKTVGRSTCRTAVGALLTESVPLGSSATGFATIFSQTPTGIIPQLMPLPAPVRLSQWLLRVRLAARFRPRAATSPTTAERAGHVGPRRWSTGASPSTQASRSEASIRGFWLGLKALWLRRGSATPGPAAARQPSFLVVFVDGFPRGKGLIVAGTTVDEEAIRSEVLGSRTKVQLKVDTVPSRGGQIRYEIVIQNPYLGLRRVLRDAHPDILLGRVQVQLLKWAEQEIRKKVATAKGEAADDAQAATEAASEVLEALRSLLRSGVEGARPFRFESLLLGLHRREEYPAFGFEEPPGQPIADEIAPTLWRAITRWSESPSFRRASQVFPWARRRLSEEDAVDQARWRARVEAWEGRRKIALDEHEKARRLFEIAQREAESRRVAANQKVGELRIKFEEGDVEAIKTVLQTHLGRSEFPDPLSLPFEVEYDSSSRTVIVDVALPPQSQLPDTVSVRFVRSRNEMVSVGMKKKDHDDLFDSVVKQATLRRMLEVFAAVESPLIDTVVVNAWVTDTDRASGRETNRCIVSVAARREQFSRLRLDRVDPSDCIKSLKGLVAGPLSELGPVQPIMVFDRKDKRFIESKDVLEGVDASTNLAEMDWEEFEQLVRELFQRIFSGPDSEVRVTQASRDGGVDAIAFDPDPIRGGKFVIQAKRYTKVIPVGAVRDLYGTMINEGAVKGILVTTAHFGPDSRDFVKDKPITLIDGPRLVYLLEQHGSKVRIDVSEARARLVAGRGQLT